MAKKATTTGNKRKTIKELQYHIDCHESTIKTQSYIIIGLVLLCAISFTIQFFN